MQQDQVTFDLVSFMGQEPKKPLTMKTILGKVPGEEKFLREQLGMLVKERICIMKNNKYFLNLQNPHTESFILMTKFLQAIPDGFKDDG